MDLYRDPYEEKVYERYRETRNISILTEEAENVFREEREKEEEHRAYVRNQIRNKFWRPTDSIVFSGERTTNST